MERRIKECTLYDIPLLNWDQLSTFLVGSYMFRYIIRYPMSMIRVYLLIRSELGWRLWLKNCILLSSFGMNFLVAIINRTNLINNLKNNDKDYLSGNRKRNWETKREFLNKLLLKWKQFAWFFLIIWNGWGWESECIHLIEKYDWMWI